MYTIIMKQGNSGNREQKGKENERTSEEQERGLFLSLEI